MTNIAHAIHWVASGMGGIQGIVTSMLFSALLLGVCLDSLSALYTAYNRACMRLENESWLRNNCKDPVFFSNMRAHTTVCADVEANARVGAFWTALREVSDDAKAYLQPLFPWILLLAVVLTMLIPLCCVCSQRLVSIPARRLRCIPLHKQSDYLKDI